MEWPSPQPANASNGPTLSCQGATAGVVSWSWPLKLECSLETRGFLRTLARYCAKSEPPLLRKRVEQVWRMRWWSILSFTAARALGVSLVDSWGGVGTDGGLPAVHEVGTEQAFAGLV